jgi:hypothetical protein
MAEPFAMPHTAGAVRHAADVVREAWIGAASASGLSAREAAVYQAGLDTEQSVVHPDGGDWLAARVVNVAKAASRLEQGHAAYHLPERINWAASRKAKRSTRGTWYLRIPLQHRLAGSGLRRSVPATANVMTDAVSRVARRLRPGQSLTAGPTRGRARHAPGLTPYRPRFARTIRLLQSRAVEEGLRRVPGGRGKPATFLTFRMLSSDSPYWWIPAKAGVHLAPQVARATEGLVRSILQEGVTRDIEAVLRERLGG